MSKEALIIAIFIALMILWVTETLGMNKTSRLLAGINNSGFFIIPLILPKGAICGR